MENYLKSKEALKDFAAIVRNARTSQYFKYMWHKKLTENNITPTGAMLPEAIVKQINDTWKSDDAIRFFKMLEFVSSGSFTAVIFDNSTAPTAGHAAKGGTAKTEEVLSSDTQQVISPEMVYKFIKIDKENERQDENGLLIKYITHELVERVSNEVVTQLVSNSVTTSKIVGLPRAFATVYSQDVTDFQNNAIYYGLKASCKVYSGGRKVLVCNYDSYEKLRGVTDTPANINDVYGRDDLMSYLDVEDIFVLDIPKVKVGTTNKNFLLCILDADAYKLTGNEDFSEYTHFDLKTNKTSYLTELYVGGNLIKKQSYYYIFGS